MDRQKRGHGQKEYGTTPNVTAETITSTKWTRPPSTLKPVMDTQKDAYMQEHSRAQEKNAQPTPPIGKVNISAVREGLAMVMDAMRVLQTAGIKMSAAKILTSPSGGKILLFPMIEVPGHGLGILVMDNGKATFTVDGVSVMEAAPVMESEKK